MQRFAKGFMVLLAALFLATPAMAMNINANNTGDALIYPLYVALDGGWQTKLTVINTSEMYSTVAKLVVRSWKNSQELLDFLLYLSPADVWTGTLKYDPALGKVVMESTDDSCLVEIGTFASATKPLYKELAATSDASDNGFLGYVYVINAATNPTPSGPSLVAKSAIFSWYHGLAGGVNGAPLSPSVYPRNVLTGYADVAWAGTGSSLALKPVAVMNYQNKVWIDAGVETVFAGIYEDPKGKIVGETSIGLVRLEDLLAKKTVRLPYYNNATKGHTFHFFTFPTKISGITDKQGFWWDIGTDLNSPADDKARSCTTAGAKIFDTTEKFSVFSPAPVASMCTEIFWLEALPNIIPFPEGWIRYSFNPVTAIYDRQAGRVAGNPIVRERYAPVIPFVINVGPQGMFSLQTAWEGGDLNRYSFFDFKPGIDVPNAFVQGVDPAWSNWYTDSGLEVTPY